MSSVSFTRLGGAGVRRGGPDIDMFKAFETGAVITPVKGKNLAIPLPAAYTVVGRGKEAGQLRKAIEVALNIKLFTLTAKSGRRFLAITPNSGQIALGRASARSRSSRSDSSRTPASAAIPPPGVAPDRAARS